jgi:dienelactone hydrolase
MIMLHVDVRAFAACLLAVCSLSVADAQQALTQRAADIRVPDDIERRIANIYSEGVRMQAEIYSPKSSSDKKLPTILMAHGWGGVAAALRRDAIGFAQKGYLAVLFDYRGWGASDSRLVLTAPVAPAQKPEGRFVAEVQEVREVVDPVDMTTDWLNAIHWLHAEPQCDTSRIGLWGSSQSGGYVIWVAARDSRVKAVYSQVGAFSGHDLGSIPQAFEEATQRARGQLGYPKPGAVVVGSLRGAPILDKFANYSPVDDIVKIKNIPIMIVMAEKEELFDNEQHGVLAYQRYQGPKKLVTVPNITHYGIYREAWGQAHQLATEWFEKHLKR